MQSFQLGEIEIQLVRKRIKNLHLRVHPVTGEVKISAPIRLSSNYIKDFAQLHIQWIKKQQLKVFNRPKQSALKLITGEWIKFQGFDYQLLVTENGRSPKAIMDEDTIHLLIKPGMTLEKKHMLIEKLYRDKLKEIIPPLIQKWEAVLGVTVNKFGIKKMKTKWGTCSIRAKRIWLNLELAKKSPACLEYIVVHEMVHLIERKHNARFYNILHEHFPHWREIKAELKKDCTYTK